MTIKNKTTNSVNIKNKEFRILIVEDNEGLALLMQRKLDKVGDEVILASTGSNCLEILQKTEIHLLFLDYKLPDMNAIDLVKKMKDINLNIPFVLVTGVGDERTAVEIMKLGARDYIIKDANLLDFLPSVASRIREELLTQAKLSMAEDALLQSEQRYRLLVENINLGIILIDTEQSIVTVNAAIGRMLEKSANDIIGMNIFEAIPFNYDILDKAQIEQMLISDKPLNNETEITVDNNKILKIRIRAFPYFINEDKIIGYIDVFEDITEQKMLQDQLIQVQKMEAVGIMAGGIAHDFNNLLTAIQGHAELALMDITENNSLHEEIIGITRSVKLGSALTNQLLLFSRKQPLKLKVIDINAVITTILTMINRILDKIIVLNIRLSENISKIKADPGNIEQVIMNLAVNAQDAMPEGGSLTIRTESSCISEAESKKFTKAVPGQYVLLSVSDTGTGIDPAIVKHIFEPFITTKEAGKGSGLGLSIVYSIVNKHNGFIDVSSIPGSGTTFNIYFPAYPQN